MQGIQCNTNNEKTAAIVINAQCNRTWKKYFKRYEHVSNTYHSVCNNCSAMNTILTSLDCSMSS